ncbi:hypothetical protein [Rahnella aquatilis]|uniref:ParE family toxin-like protein n=1 Tax=unclassified Sodalis (in: enterobacteria) TaxID=2636512 RepID=UPI0016547B19
MTELLDFNPRQHITPAVRRKAIGMVNSLESGQKVCKRLDVKGYLKIDIGPFWRMLSKDGGHRWFLMNHETYNREIKK